MNVGQFIEINNKTHCVYQYVEWARQHLIDHGYVELFINEDWVDIPKKFFCTVDERSIIALNIHDTENGVISGAHIDYPQLKVSPLSYFHSGGIDGCRVVRYGGVTNYTWLDRDLALCGAVYIKQPNGTVKRVIIDTKEPIGVIPSLAVHLDHKHDTSPTFQEKHFTVLLGPNEPEETTPRHSKLLMEIIARCAECDIEDIVDFDLNFYDSQPTTFNGAGNELLCGQGFDDGSCAITSLLALTNSGEPTSGLIGVALFDNEEIGSLTYAGAKSSLLWSVLSRAGCGTNFRRRALLLSADVSHADNPNYHSFITAGHSISAEGGPVIFLDQDGSAASDMQSLARVKRAASKLGVPLQIYTNENYAANGTTIGPDVSARLGLAAVDVGVPVLAMHSLRETITVTSVVHMYMLVLSVFGETCPIEYF